MKTTKSGWRKLFLAGMSVMALAFGLVVMGCSSTPKAPATIQAGAATLNGKSAVVIPITLAERSKAKRSDQQKTDVMDIVTPGLWAMTVNSFAKNVDSVADRNQSQIDTKLNEMFSAFVNSYNSLYNTSLKEVSFDFGKKTPAVTFFNKPGKDAISQITKICTDNNAEFAIAILYQFVDGEIVAAVTSEDSVKLNASIVVFDKTGKIIAVNNGQTGSVNYRFVYLKTQISQEELTKLHDDNMMRLYDNLKDVIVNFASVL